MTVRCRLLRIVVSILTLVGHVSLTVTHTTQAAEQELRIVHGYTSAVGVSVHREQGAAISAHCHACAEMGVATPLPTPSFCSLSHRVSWPPLLSTATSIASHVEPPPPRRLVLPVS